MERLIVALDVDSFEKAKKLVDKLYPTVKIFKVGSHLFTACGPEAVKIVADKGAKVFLDLKFHDIPKTVFSAVLSGTGLCCEPVFVSAPSLGVEKSIEKAVQPAVFMMTVHIDGGKEMLQAAVRGATEKANELGIKRPFIIGVTVLTSENLKDNTEKIVLEKAKIAQKAGLDGIVCSVLEAPIIRKEFGKSFIIVTPGIRPKDYRADDQRRTATVEEALKAGADYIVIGRPIIEAKDPLGAAKKTLAEIS